MNEAKDIKKIVAKFIEDFDNIRWGWDGDCGSSRLVERLGEEVLGDIFLNAPDIGRFVSPWSDEAERYYN